MPKTTVFRLWTHGFPRHEVDRFGNETDTMMTVDVHDAEDYWGPCITIGRDDLDKIQNSVIRFDEPEQLDAFITRLQEAAKAWKETP